MAPVIETERLTLRAHAMEDFEAYCALWSDPSVVRFIGGKPFTRELSWQRFLRHPGIWHYLGFGYLALTERESGRFIGEAGFHDMRRDIAPSIEGTLEAGWALMPEMQGRGYALEAMQAIVAWADQAHPGRRMTCIIEPANVPSVRIASRLGFTEFARSTYHGTPLTLYERTA